MALRRIRTADIIALRNDTPDELYAHLTDPKNAEYRKNDPKLTRRYADMCWPTKAWLEEHGVKFLSTSTAAGKYDSQHHESYLHIFSEGKDDDVGGIHPQPNGGYRTGRGIMMPFKAYFEKKGGVILMATRPRMCTATRRAVWSAPCAGAEGNRQHPR